VKKDDRPRCKAMVKNPRYPIQSGEPRKECGRLEPCKLHPARGEEE
jgi:hypothetical protein